MCPAVGSEGWLRCLSTPQVVVCAEGMGSTLLLLLTSHFHSRLLKSGRWVFSVSVSSGPELPLQYMRTVMFSPRESLCILKLKKRCAQAQALQQRIPGLSLAQLD